MAPHSSTFAWKIPWMEEPGRLQSMGLLESDTTERLHFHFLLSCVGEGHGNPLQCSCLENPRHGGAWWTEVYGVAQSWTRLKQLSSSSSSMFPLESVFPVWVLLLTNLFNLSLINIPSLSIGCLIDPRIFKLLSKLVLFTLKFSAVIWHTWTSWKIF